MPGRASLQNRRPAAPCTPGAVRDAAGAAGFLLTDAQGAALAAYLGLLEKWNRVINLTGPGAWRDIFDRLVIDSLHLDGFVRSLPLPRTPLCRDLGAGAGLPGIPLRILWQEGGYTLIEAREKRALFLGAALSACPLPGVSVFRGRAEAYMAAHPPAHLTVSRAFLPWARVLALVRPHTEAGGLCVFLTLSPLPDSLPAGWEGIREYAYPVGTDTRFFWALRRM